MMITKARQQHRQKEYYSYYYHDQRRNVWPKQRQQRRRRRFGFLVAAMILLLIGLLKNNKINHFFFLQGEGSFLREGVLQQLLLVNTVDVDNYDAHEWSILDHYVENISLLRQRKDSDED